MASGISGHLGADDYASMYESRSALTTIQKQHFVEWFSGSALPSYWTLTNTAGTGSVAMADEVDGGIAISTGATQFDGCRLVFNNKRQYAPADSTVIVVSKRDANCGTQVGFCGATQDLDSATINNDSSGTYYGLRTADATTPSLTDTNVGIDTSYHTHKIICGSSNIINYIDGVIKVTKTTNRPTLKMQPCLFIFSRTTGAKIMNSTYMECYNT
jgi:hypothetical protein